MPTHLISTQREKTHIYRPRSVGFAGWLIFLQGWGFLGAGALRFVVFYWGSQGIDFLTSLASQDPDYLLFSACAWTILGLLAIACALALWRMRSLAWVASMLLQMVALTIALVSYLRGGPNYLAMLFGVVIVLTLNNQEVQDAFRH